MNKGQKILLILAAALVAMAGIVYWLIMQVKKPTMPGNTVGKPAEVSVPVSQPSTFTLPALSSGERDRATIQTMVMAFAERFGTYSNQNGGFEASLLQPVVSTSFYQWLSTAYVSQLNREYPAGKEYAGVSTDAVAVEFKTVTETDATVVIATQQTVQKGTVPVTEKRNLQVALVKSEAGWKVDGAYWQKP